jgi:poly(beta-D-mannuronate) lyase
MTVGCCGPKFDYHDSKTIVEYNLWERARPTSAEMVSIKSSAATFRYNTVVSSDGDVDIRAGRHNSIYGNYLLGGRGIRLYEDDHLIYNNYVVAGLRAGPADASHAAVKNAVIVFNTFVGGVNLSGGVRFSNNLLLGGGGGGGTGNLTGSPEALGLTRTGDLYTLTSASKAVGAAGGTESLPFLTDDIQGKPRGARPDVGAEQLSPAPGLRRPLTAADVGPNAP